MQLLSLELQNFQAHEKTEIQFSPIITCVKGATDAGKSSILRALRWVCLNDLGGDEFVREGEKKAIVKLKVDLDDFGVSTLTRTKSVASTGINTYELDEKEYKSFATSVPADIAKLLNLNEINFQGQHDAPFWFNETAGEVSRRLNSVIDLSVIDFSLSYVAAQVRLAQERNMLTQERLDTAKKELEDLEPQRERIQSFQEIKDRHEKLEGLTDDCRRLEEFTKQISGLHNRRDRLETQALEGDEVLKLAKEARRFQKRQEGLSHLVNEISDQQSKAQPPPDTTALDKAWSTWNLAARKTSDLRLLISQYSNQLSVIRRKNEEAATTEEIYHSKIKGQLCPLCQKPL